MNELGGQAERAAIDSLSPAHLLLFPSFAYRVDADRPWRIDVQGVSFLAQQKHLKRKLLLKLLLHFIDVPPEGFDGPLFQSRVSPFFYKPYKGKRVQIHIGARTYRLRRRTRRDGQFRGRVSLSEPDLQQLIEAADRAEFAVSAATVNGKSQVGRSRVRVIQPKGISVISDVDDTIKVSNVENRSELLINTFFREFREVPEIGDVYRWLDHFGVEFHYVSASPWQLYEPLNQMLLDFGFPHSSMHLRNYKLTDHMLKRLGVIHRGGKASAVRRILARFPQRQFILIGDSGEKDIAIYSRCYQERPHQVRHIFIRLLRPEHRYNEAVIEAKINLPPGSFGVFETATELKQLLAASSLLQQVS